MSFSTNFHQKQALYHQDISVEIIGQWIERKFSVIKPNLPDRLTVFRDTVITVYRHFCLTRFSWPKKAESNDKDFPF